MNSKQKETTTQIELTLVNVSSYDTNDKDAVTRFVDSYLAKYTVYCNAGDALQHTTPPPLSSLEVQQAVRHDVERFLKPRDKVLALGSVLLKNRAFWQVNADTSTAWHPTAGSNATTTLVRLPRTQHKKPYIPKIHSATLIDIDDGSVEPCIISQPYRCRPSGNRQ